jgi:3-isopropylmalate/(R)-2-methylmalate dehydratase large subunit
MAVEAGGFTGIIEADEVVVDYLARQRARPRRCARDRARPTRGRLRAPSTSTSRARARWSRRPATRATACLSRAAARRGEDPHRLRRLVHRRQEGRHGHVRLGARARRRRKGARVAPGVKLYIQFGSPGHPRVRRAEGLHRRVREGAGRAHQPVCGACIKAGPGVSVRPTRSRCRAINRNFPGRSGPGQVYLASPATRGRRERHRHEARPARSRRSPARGGRCSYAPCGRRRSSSSAPSACPRP